MKFKGSKNLPDDYGRPVISPIWLAEQSREERERVFGDTIQEFIRLAEERAVVEYDPADEGVQYLSEAITRLGLDGEVEAYLDDDTPPHILLEKM